MSLRNATRRIIVETAVGLRFDELALWLRTRASNAVRARLVVVAMHETPARYEANLRRQLEWAAKHFRLIGPSELPSMWDRPQAASSRPSLLFTFDDGRESNYKIAALLLESVGARGIFFVVPDFIEAGREQARHFYYSHIDVRGLPASNAAEDWMPINPQQLRDLSNRGHAIGNHTLSHTRIDGLSSCELNRQVMKSAEKISGWTGKPVDHFAWPYSWDAIDQSAWDFICKTHRFCFAPCAGTVNPPKDSAQLIWRNEVESYYPDAEARFMYSGLVAPAWASRRRQLRTILRSA